MEPQRDVFEPLNGMRGVAALCVVLFHSERIMGMQLAPHGYLAVDLFFVLSGFVIAHAYEPRFKRGLGPFMFFWWRVKRFYPLYSLGLVLGVVAIGIDMVRPPAPMPWRDYAAAIIAGALFLPLPLKDLYPLNVPAWSLLCELLINLVYGLLWRRTWFLALMAAVAWAGLLTRNIQSAELVTGMLRACFSFPVGVLIYRYRQKIPRVPAWPVIIGLAVVLLSPVPEMLSITLLFPVGIAFLANCENRRGFEMLGRLSFPLYAVHWPILQLGLGIKRYVPLPPLAQGFAWMAVAVVAAWVAERLDERIRHRSPRRLSTSPESPQSCIPNRSYPRRREPN